jgi:subtilisin family serine protease
LKEKSKENVLKAIAHLEQIDGILSVEPNYFFQVEIDPNEPDYEYGGLWGLNGPNGINTSDAWNLTRGNNTIRVGIIDTGIANHADLDANLIEGRDIFNNNNVTNDDTNSHGTHVAGTVGAVGNNEIGVVGVNWNVSLVPLQVANADNQFRSSDVVEAIEWAEDRWGTDDQISVLNFSGGGFGEAVTIRDEIDNFNGLFVWSAGNDGEDIDVLVSKNESFNYDNLISVGGLHQNGTRRSSSNYSTNNTNVHIYAPGTNIYSTVPTWYDSSGYGFKSGTSMAAPHVTGVAALMLSVNPDMTGGTGSTLGARLKHALISNSDTISITIPDGSNGMVSQNVRKLNAFMATSAVAFTTGTAPDGASITGFRTGFSLPNNSELTFPERLAPLGTTTQQIVTKITSYAFDNQSQITNVSIPASVTNIGSNAFEDCTNLESVTIQREIAEMTNLGSNVFAGCYLLEVITVPTNRIIDYKNATNWSFYSSLMDYTDSIPINPLHCLSDYNITTTLEPGYNKIYKLVVECAKSYKITSSALYAIEMSLYDSNMNLFTVSPTMSDNNCKGIISSYLSPGTYYIDLRFEDNLSNGNIETNYKLTWASNGWSISYNTDNNVLTHLHEITQDNYLNKLYYINNQGAGFYELKLTGTTTDGTTVYYPEGAITIYNDSSRNTPMDKYTLTGYSNLAKTSQNMNSMIVYLPRNGYFYIDVNMTSSNLSSLYLNINPLEYQEINLFSLSESTNEFINLLNETVNGDYFQKLIVNQTGYFTISTSYAGTPTLFVLTKLNYNASSNTYTLETKICELIDAVNTFAEIVVLEDGTYYVGYFNKNDTSSFDVTFNRLVSQYGSHVLVTDPDPATLCGSQINIIEMNNTNKSYRQSFITKQFTRIIYPDYNYEISASRLDYHWYSSNETIATVTDFGTVLGKNVGTVKIMAVLKSDPSKVFAKEFTIINDTGTEQLVVTSTYTVKYLETNNGKFKLHLEKVNCPYPWFQDYNFSVFIPDQANDIGVNIDEWGYITVSGTGFFTLTGIYLKNSRVTVVINVIIEP